MPILKVSIRQVKAARSLLDWSQEDLAARSGVSLPTIKRLEAEDHHLGGRSETGQKIIYALEAVGVEFINGGRPGVRMQKPGESADQLTKRIERLKAAYPPVDDAEPKSPQKAMRQLTHAHAKNEITKLKNRRATLKGQK